jgi:hypothetical protein
MVSRLHQLFFIATATLSVPIKAGGTDHRNYDASTLSTDGDENHPVGGSGHGKVEDLVVMRASPAASESRQQSGQNDAALPDRNGRMGTLSVSAVEAQAGRNPRAYRGMQTTQGGDRTEIYTTVGVGYCRGWSAKYSGECGLQDLLGVNGRAKDGFSNESGCATVCDDLPSCVGYAYVQANDCIYATVNPTYCGRCFVYGQGLEQGLKPLQIQSRLTEWEGYPQDNAKVKCSNGSPGVICKRNASIPLYETCAGNKHTDACGKDEGCGCTNPNSSNFDASAKIDNGSCLCQASDKNALLAAIMTSPLHFRHLNGWDQSSDPCGADYGAAWGGVTCAAGRVTRVDFSGCDRRRALQFQLGPALGQLEELICLNLATTKVEGSLPEELGSLPKLEQLTLDFTAISGTLPQTIGNLSRLRRLRFIQTQRALPQWNEKLSTISGTLPHSIGGLVSLEHIEVVFSSLSGTLPQSFYNLRSLQYVCFASTLLSGTVSAEIGGVLTLQQFLFSFTSMSGTLPMAMFGLSALQIVNMASTQLSGTISTSVGEISQLYQLSLAASQVSGTLPLAIGHLENLETLEVQLTHVSGTLPDTIGSLSNLDKLHI